MAQIMAFAGSNSSTSINFQLVTYTVEQIDSHETRVVNLAHFPFPMYSEDLEKEAGFPQGLIALKDQLAKAEGLVLSVNEHNSGPSAYFKNVVDWLSRIDRNFLQDTKIFLMATSGGKRGATGSLTFMAKLLPRFGGELTSTFSLPRYYDNFKPGDGILEAGLRKAHRQQLDDFLSALQ